MSRLRRRTPCDKCPWLRCSRAGWLGADTPADFLVKTFYGEGDMPCHCSINYTDRNWRVTQLPNSSLCAGGLQFLNNILKLPQLPDMAEACRTVGKNPQVFAWPSEFLSHHLRHPVELTECWMLMQESWNRLQTEWAARQ